jgi:hypothetical protein
MVMGESGHGRGDRNQREMKAAVDGTHGLSAFSPGITVARRLCMVHMILTQALVTPRVLDIYVLRSLDNSCQAGFHRSPHELLKYDSRKSIDGNTDSSFLSHHS